MPDLSQETEDTVIRGRMRAKGYSEREVRWVLDRRKRADIAGCAVRDFVEKRVM